jgi:hypothetical protein
VRQNLALLAAQGQIIAYTDDDCRLTKYYVTNLLRYDTGDSDPDRLAVDNQNHARPDPLEPADEFSTASTGQRPHKRQSASTSAVWCLCAGGRRIRTIGSS